MTDIDGNNDDCDNNNNKKNDQELVLWHGPEIKYQANLLLGKRRTS